MLNHVLADIVINHVQRAMPKAYVFQFGFNGGEYDMIVLDHEKHTMSIYEIRYSTEAVAAQAKHFCNKDILARLESHYYPVCEKCVLYMGKNDTKYLAYDMAANEYVFSAPESADVIIEYRNAGEFLRQL